MPDDDEVIPDPVPNTPPAPPVPDPPPGTPPAPGVASEDDDELEGETFRTVKKFNRAMKATREPAPNPPGPSLTPPEPPPPAPGPAPQPSPAKGRGGLLDPFRRTR